MGNEVRLTLFATGFGLGNQISSTPRETAIDKSLKNLKAEADLDKPAYLRFKGTYKR